MWQKILSTLTVALLTFSAHAQGTVNFYNRGLTGPNGTTYNARVFGMPASSTAQLFLLTGTGPNTTYTPVAGIQTFRPPPNQEFFTEPVLAIVPGQAPGTTGLQLVVRVWGGPSYKDAFIRAESPPLTVGPLGGENPNGGPAIPPPDLGGPNGVGGLQSFGFVPEPSTYAMAVIGGVLLMAYRRKRPVRPLRTVASARD